MPFGGLYSTIEADLGKDYSFTREKNDSAKEYALKQLKNTELKDYLNITNALMGNASCPKYYHSVSLMASQYGSAINFKYWYSNFLGEGGTYITIQN